VSGFFRALGHLTVLAPSRAGDGGLQPVGRAAHWFGAIGLGIGLGLLAVDRVTRSFFPPLLAALLLVTAWKLVTGGVHLRGLANAFEGLAGRGQPSAALRGGEIGTSGALGLILFLMMEIGALVELDHPMRSGALLTAPVVARAMPPLVPRLFPPTKLRWDAASFASGVSAFGALAGVAIAVAVAMAALGGVGIVAAIVGAVIALALVALLSRNRGGITGDALDAGVETAELVVLATVLAWTRARP
jgi:adenosylcobinamide-GDP ribazoletransferase